MTVALDLLNTPVQAVLARRSAAGRYAVVSAVNVVSHQVLLAVANSGWGWSGGWANTFATMVVAVPGYLMSRRWVFRSTGRHSLRAEILPFWGIALVALVVSSVLAEGADRLFGPGLPVALGSIAGSVVVWIAKFVVLEHLFRRQPAPG